MPLPTTLENDPILWEEMTVQEKPQVQVATLPACERESETKLAKAPVLMAALPSPINPSSRPMTPESLFGEISDPKYVTYPVPDEAIPPIFIRCMNCWRNDHPTGSQKCEFQQLRKYWQEVHEEELVKQSSHSKAQLAFLATGYCQLQTSYNIVLARLKQLELENSQLRAANTQLHANKSSR